MTSPHTHAHHSHQGRPGHGPAAENDSELGELLDLDAAFAAPVLAAALDAASDALGAEPTAVVDLGAGTGTGTIALATRFAGARIHGLDASASMLERLRTAAVAAGVTDRIETHLVDLDGDWPAIVPRDVDVAWAALSLHHTSDPDQVLRQVFEVLRPGGVLIITEFAGTTAYEPADLGTSSTALGDRLVTALAARGYPVTADWTTALTTAGFDTVTRREMPVVISADTRPGARFLALHLARNREILAGDLSAADLAALDAAIAALSAGTPDLTSTSGRVFWVAVRP